MNNEIVSEVKSAHKIRAQAYYYLFKEMEKELGIEKAKEIFQNAMYKMGSQKSASKYSDAAKENASILCGEFVNKNEVHKHVFSKKEISSDKEKCFIEMHSCPLVEAWKEMGLSPDEIKLLCDTAYYVDFGTFEPLGYELKFSKRIADKDACCSLELSKK